MAQQAKFFYATGRRKTSSARVFLYPISSTAAAPTVGEGTVGEGEAAESAPAGVVTINGRAFDNYFPIEVRRTKILAPLESSDRLSAYNITATVSGGGFTGQADAVKLGIARALQIAEPELHSPMRKGGFLTRDARIVERKKAGRHKARKRPQYSKR